MVFAFVWLKGVQTFRTIHFPYRKLLIVDGAGNTLTSLPVLRRGGYGLDTADEFDSVWLRSDVAQLCAAAGLAYNERSFDDTEELQRAHPGAMRLYGFYAHPQRYVWGSVLLVFAVIAVLILIAAVAAVVG
ncbi:MAG: hypothetical protein QOG50_3019 [Actinomycetota bacterium]|nr:hypothetical protein [Actinomycetota bacterium]